MTQPIILVTGATGNTGGAIVSELLRKGVPVRAMVRRRDARSSALEARGAELVVADLFDPDQLVAAMRGAQRAYFVSPYTPTRSRAPSRSRLPRARRSSKPSSK